MASVLRLRKPLPLAGQTVVITGAASGMGRALAQRLSAHGSPVALVDYDGDGLADTTASLAGPCLSERLDVRDGQGQLAFAARVFEWSPRPIGAVFNNAGVLVTAAVADKAIEDDEWLLDINLRGLVHGVRAFLPVLLRQGSGAIVNTSSIYGLAGMPYHSAYCASKFAVRGLTDSLRHELAGTGVRAVTVHPGYVKTEIAHRGRIRDPDDPSRTHHELAAEFHSMCRMTADRAAAIIHRGVDAGKARILVGAEAYVFDAATRITPTYYGAALGRFERMFVRLGRFTGADHQEESR
jgi:NAD(P)-dependent dehydrogenase (short-subunit alcohol dehydrogenase family)